MKKMIQFSIIVAILAIILLLCSLLNIKKKATNSTIASEENTEEQVDTTTIRVAKRVFNLIILDESGSMGSIQREAITGVNETIKTIKGAQDQCPEQEQLFSLVTFSDPMGVETPHSIIDTTSIKKVHSISAKEYSLNGVTALLDAMGYALTTLEKKVTADDNVLVTIISDGLENASKDFDLPKIIALINRLSEGCWTFAYIGANQDSRGVAKSMNIENFLNFEADRRGTQEMWRKERQSRAGYYRKSRVRSSKDAMEKGYFLDD